MKESRREADLSRSRSSFLLCYVDLEPKKRRRETGLESEEEHHRSKRGKGRAVEENDDRVNEDEGAVAGGMDGGDQAVGGRNKRSVLDVIVGILDP